jgi:hypothetical protein
MVDNISKIVWLKRSCHQTPRCYPMYLPGKLDLRQAHELSLVELTGAAFEIQV